MVDTHMKGVGLLFHGIDDDVHVVVPLHLWLHLHHLCPSVGRTNPDNPQDYHEQKEAHTHNDDGYHTYICIHKSTNISNIKPSKYAIFFKYLTKFHFLYGCYLKMPLHVIMKQRGFLLDCALIGATVLLTGRGWSNSHVAGATHRGKLDVLNSLLNSHGEHHIVLLLALNDL